MRVRVSFLENIKLIMHCYLYRTEWSRIAMSLGRCYPLESVSIEKGWRMRRGALCVDVT